MTMKRMTGLVLGPLVAVATRVGAQPPAQVTPQRVEFNERVVELTEPVMRGFLNGLDVELGLLVDFAKLLATYKTPAEYRHCGAQVARLPEFQKIQEQVLTWPDNPTPEQMQRLGDKMAADQADLLKRKCGGDIETEWPDTKRREKVEEIQAKAAAAAEPATSPTSPPSPPSPTRGPAAIDSAPDALARWGGSAPETDVIKQVIKKERAYRYCLAMKEALQSVQEAVRELTEPAQALKLPGSGKDIYWMYSKDEVKAIGPNCEELRPKILVLEQLEAKIKDCPGGTECVTIRVGEAVEITQKLTLKLGPIRVIR